jgi:uncharacterized Zn-binding protein involved in type VI secretion
MGQPAARIGDLHVCPMQTPGVPPIPHVGGPIIGPGAPTVLIGGMPAAVVGDSATCVGPPDTIVMGSMGVMLCGKPAARVGDTTSHGGSIAVGFPMVLIGDMAPGAPPVVVVPPIVSGSAPASQSSQSSSSAASPNAVHSQQVPRPASALPSSARAGATSQTSQKKTWVAFKLVDDAGKAVVGEKYRLLLPDGSTRDGLTDIKGEVRVDGTDPGSCKISFPDLDENDWKSL